MGAIFAGFASVTPLELDLTAFHAMPILEEWRWNGEEKDTGLVVPDSLPVVETAVANAAIH